MPARACDKFEKPGRPQYVVGSIGPGTKSLTLGNTTWDVMEDSYAEQVRGLIAGGADVLLIETQQDLLVIKCAIAAANRAMLSRPAAPADHGAGIVRPEQRPEHARRFGPVGVCRDLPALFDEVEVPGPQLRLWSQRADRERCATSPSNWPRLVSALPNAGQPIIDESRKARFPMTPPDFTRGMMRFVEEFGVNIVGGCCGTMPEHLKMLVEAVGNRPPKARNVVVKPQISSLYSAEDIRQDNSYFIVAERTNTNGSRQFKRLLQADDLDGLVSMARDEVREGSHMLDVCVDFVGRDGVRDMHEVICRFARQVKPGSGHFMLDSTNPAVMEAGLKLAGGRCILNSMNLEDGEERVAHICGLAKKYGAAVVAGTIDEDKLNAMARTAERKISIARRIRDLAVNKYGLRDEDLLFDPLVLPVSTGIEEDRRNALETIEGTRRISSELPAVPHRRRSFECQLRPEAGGAGGAEQRVPSRAAGSGPDRRDRSRLQDPAEEPDP